jgi:hypothetical protein
MLNVRSLKNIKTSTLKKAWKSSHFRPDNQRQISLDLSHTCRIRKRLISLINSATFFEIIRLARCEYSKLVSVYSFPEGSVLVSEGGCAYIQRGVSVSLPFFYSLIIVFFAKNSRSFLLRSLRTKISFVSLMLTFSQFYRLWKNHDLLNERLKSRHH